MRRVAVPDLTTTVLTLTLTGIASDATSGQGSRVGRRLVPIAAMFIGALIGSMLVVGGHGSAALGVIAILLAAVAALAQPRSTQRWAAKP